jgi:hypothetical protein
MRILQLGNVPRPAIGRCSLSKSFIDERALLFQSPRDVEGHSQGHCHYFDRVERARRFARLGKSYAAALKRAFFDS